MHVEILIRRAAENDALKLAALAERTFRTAFAEANNAADMKLHCAATYERNPRALAFYRKWGFDVVGDHIFRVGNDPQRDLIMRREI